MPTSHHNPRQVARQTAAGLSSFLIPTTPHVQAATVPLGRQIW
jgi:hypothetical protein